MKIAIFSLSEINPGKQNVKDERLDQLDKLVKAKKKTYIQVELAGENAAAEADAILVSEDSTSDLILNDLEFVETRLSRSEGEQEKTLLSKLKNILEKEEFIFKSGLSVDEQKAMSGYSLFTVKPVVIAKKEDLNNLSALLSRALKESGFISFFTTGEKETRAWLIPKDTTAWEAAGVIHSDIQRGFICAEIIGFNDFIQAGGENQAKQAGKMRLEKKDYVIQDCDIANFRFNK